MIRNNMKIIQDQKKNVYMMNAHSVMVQVENRTGLYAYIIFRAAVSGVTPIFFEVKNVSKLHS